MRHYSYVALAVLLTLSALLCVRTENVGLTTEICGDGIDQDSDGVDLLCPGDDKDYDGFPRDQDCDDTNRYIYDGISVACSCTDMIGWKTCKGSTFTSCECATPLCEATGDGKCYYVDPINGNDANTGTYSEPWASYLKFVSYYSENLNAIKLSDGDYVYFMNGTYSDKYMYSDQSLGMFFRALHPTTPITLKNYPGHYPKMNAPGTSAINVLQCSNIIIEGFEVTSPSYGAGIYIAEVANITIRNCWVHDIDGVDNNNIAGVHLLTSYNGHVHHNRIHDNYDRTNADTGGGKTENSRNMVLFNGGDNKILYNIIYQTKDPLDPITGGGITYKHRGDDDKTFEVAYNYFWNIGFHAVGSGTANSHVHHNLIVNSIVGFSFKDHGGPTSLFGSVIEYNTLVSTIGVIYTPVDTYGTQIGSFEYSNNVLVANTEEYDRLHPTGEEKPLININRYGSNDDYTKTVPYLTFDDNCYAYNAGNEKSWDLFSLGESNGASYTISEWQGVGFDKNSFVEDPVLNTYFVATSTSCKGKGFSGTNPTSPVGSSSPTSKTPSKSATSSAALTVTLSGVLVVALLSL